MKRFLLVISAGLAISLSSKSQLYVNKATFFIDQGAVVTVEGDVTSDTSILGSGKLYLNGGSLQNVNMDNANDAVAKGFANGYTIPFLEINNAANASLNSKAVIQDSISFVAGKISIGNNDITLSQNCKAKGMASGMFVETNGSGVCRRTVSSNFANIIMPIGLGTNYRPVSFTNSAGTYAAGANITTKIILGTSPNKHVRAETYLNNYWPVTQTGITGGNLSGIASYVDPTDVNIPANEADLAGTYFNGTDWTNAGGSQNAGANTVGANITSNAGHLYGQNLFVLTNLKAFLQGAYDTTSGLMSDLLRTTAAYNPGNAPTGRLIPLNDPYRGAPYNNVFTHVKNSTQEVVSATVFNDQTLAQKNVVDWVFLELKNANASPGSTVLATRSALILRDGSIVDIDGQSPVYFNMTGQSVPGNYTLGIRHRNHLGIWMSSGGSQSLTMAPSNLDFTSMASPNLRGSSGTNYFYYATNNVKLMYAGNTNSAVLDQQTGLPITGATRVNYSGSQNDVAYILTTLGGNPVTTQNNVYSVADVNMNRRVNYSGSQNDVAFILKVPLLSNPVPVKPEAVHN